MKCKNCGTEITDGSDGCWIDDDASAWCDDGTEMHEPEKTNGDGMTEEKSEIWIYARLCKIHSELTERRETEPLFPSDPNGYSCCSEYCEDDAIVQCFVRVK